MRRSGTRGERPYEGAGDAGDLGWDDSLYEEGSQPRLTVPPHQRGSVPNDDDVHDADSHAHGDQWVPPKPPKSRLVLKWLSISLALLICVTAGAGYLYYRKLNSNITQADLNLGKKKLDDKQANAAGQTPLDILLLGSDSRDKKENQRLGGARDQAGRPPLADVQMLLHVSADRSNMSVVSIPRDTIVTIPECEDPETGKIYPKTTTETINTSLGHGGPGCTVATWEELTGVPIDHFMMIDFAGVVSMADAVGGVPVCVEENISDSKSHLRLEKGETTIKGEQALQWLRTRHGFEDGSDIGRTHAQHQYMNSMVRQLKAGTKLTDPGKLRALAEAATKALTVDEGLGSVKKLYDLGNDLQAVPSKRITMTTMPFVYDPNDPNRVIPKKGDADVIWKLLRDDIGFDGLDKKKKKKPKAKAEPNGDIPIAVQNGTGSAVRAPVTGRASALSAELRRLGYGEASADATPKAQADTSVQYHDDQSWANALAVAKSLGLPKEAVKKSDEVDEVTLIIGGDWREGTAYPEGAGDWDDKAPDSANPLFGDNKSACMEVNPAHVW